MSVSEKCPSYKESNKGSKERQGPTLGVYFTEVSIKIESTVVCSENGHYGGGGGHLEEDYPITMVFENKRFSTFSANGPIPFINLRAQVSSNGFKVFNGCTVEP